jgi:hypothetical protein
MAHAIRVGLDEVARHFEGWEGPRSSVNLQHPLVSVVVISLMAVLAGASPSSSVIDVSCCPAMPCGGVFPLH